MTDPTDLASAPAHPAPFHILVLEDGLMAARAPGADWRVFQAQFAGFKTALGPFDLETLLDVLFSEWESLSWREAEIRLWATSTQALLDLEAPPLL